MAPLDTVILPSMVLVAGAAAAQSTTGTISGRVVDAQGLAVPGVTVTAASANLQGVRETVTSGNGDYFLTLLPLTANPGLRWDRNDGSNSNGELVAKESAISPRLGVVWDPTGEQRWSVTASFASPQGSAYATRRSVATTATYCLPLLPL